MMGCRKLFYFGEKRGTGSPESISIICGANRGYKGIF
jgi:hypothetical protein